MIRIAISEPVQQLPDAHSTSCPCVKDIDNITEIRHKVITYLNNGWTWSFWRLSSVAHEFYDCPATDDYFVQPMRELERYNRIFTIGDLDVEADIEIVVVDIVTTTKFYYLLYFYFSRVNVNAHYVEVLDDFFTHYMAVTKFLLHNNVIKRSVVKHELVFNNPDPIKNINMGREEIRAWAQQNSNTLTQ